jgi:PAS domain S-box-containing protein
MVKRLTSPPYLVAALAVAAAVGLRLSLDPILGTYSPYLPFMAAVLVAARLGGRGPGFFATALGILSVWYFFVEPRFSFGIRDPYAAVGLVLFAVLSGAISILGSPGTPDPRYSDILGASMVHRIAMLGGAALALGVLAAFLWASFKRAADADRLVEHSYEVLNAAASVKSSLVEAESAARGFLLTSDDQFERAYRSAIAGEERFRETLHRLTSDDPAQRARLNEFNTVVRERLDVLANSIQAHREHPNADTVSGMRGEHRCEALMDRLRAILSAVESEERGLLERRIALASAEDANTRWILGLGNGSLVLLLVIAGAVIERNMHEHKRAEKILQQQSRLIDLSHDAIILADRDRMITGWNAGAAEMYGWNAEQAAGKFIHEFLQTSSSIPTPDIDEGLACQGRWEGELVHTRSDGRQIVTESRHVLLRDDDGRPAGYLEINRDITARKQAEEALRDREAQFRAALASMTDAVFISDANGHFIHFNDAFATFHRFGTKEECARRFAEYPGILDVFFPDGMLAPLDMWAVPRALRGESVTGAEYSLRRKDTGEQWVGSYSFGPIRDQDGRIVGSVVVARDTTDAKRVADEIRRLNSELEQRVLDRTAQLEAANKELEAFAYSVSHDLRAPLRGIDGWSLALLEDYGPQLEPQATQYLNRVRSETQRMGHLIDDLLQLSRITRAEMRRDTVNLSRIAEGVAGRLREDHPQRPLEFVVQPGMIVLGDKRLLEVAMTNLLHNAVKFTGLCDRAHIEFAASKTTASRLSSSAIMAWASIWRTPDRSSALFSGCTVRRNFPGLVLDWPRCSG